MSGDPDHDPRTHTRRPLGPGAGPGARVADSPGRTDFRSAAPDMLFARPTPLAMDRLV